MSDAWESIESVNAEKSPRIRFVVTSAKASGPCDSDEANATTSHRPSVVTMRHGRSCDS